MCANKHKSSTQKIIPKHSKDLHIVNGEGGTLVSFPTSIELRTFRLEFLTKENIDEEAYKKSSVHMITYSSFIFSLLQKCWRVNHF
jgi:hypothetical protein